MLPAEPCKELVGIITRGETEDDVILAVATKPVAALAER
jgi:hypothetical protein